MRVKLDGGALGATRDSAEFRVNSHRLAQFAGALCDPTPDDAAGRIAHPVFAHVPVMQSMVEVIGGAAPGFVLHGEHDFLFHRPIEPGQRLFATSVLLGMRQTRAGALLVVRSTTETDGGDLVTTQFSTCLMPDGEVEAPTGDLERPRPSLDGADTERRETVTHLLAADIAVRYADAARDYSAYTLDADAARQAGLPAPILHGMCSLAFAASAVTEVACAGDSRSLARLGCRFANPVFLTGEQTLETRVEVGPPEGAERLVRFETVDGEGRVIMSNGYAGVRT